MARCADCESENREGGHFCEACGAQIDPGTAQAELEFARTDFEDEAPVDSATEAESEPDPIDMADAGPAPEPDEPEQAGDELETEGEAQAESIETEDEPPAPPVSGYLVFPDNTEQPIPPSQWLIGRADLAKYLPDPDKANEISRGHITVFQEGDKFYIEDGKTMVQSRPSANKTWLVRGSSRILVTGNGRSELQDADEIDIAELLKLSFVIK